MTTIYKLHESSIKTIPTDAKGVSFENEGLSGHVTKAGSIVIRYRYSVNKGPRRKFKIGSYPENTIKQLSTAYKKAVGKVALGEDPQGEREQERVDLELKQLAAETERTLAQVGREFIEQHSKEKKSSWKEDQRIFKSYILPCSISKLPIHKIKKGDLINVLANIGKDAPVQANRVRSWLSKCFNWADGRYIEGYNPALRLPANPETPRTRILSEQEIRLFWQHLDVVENDEVRKALKAILLTAQRPREVATVHSAHIEDGKWIIPASKNKSKRRHLVLLGPLAKEILQGDGYIFPSERADHIHPSTITHAMSDVMEAAGIVEYYCKKREEVMPVPTPHDLRRTAATQIESGFSEYLMHRILNHSKGKMAMYPLYEYEKEKTEAMNWWDRKLKRILGQPIDNVIQISA
jgi:integrase